MGRKLLSHPRSLSKASKQNQHGEGPFLQPSPSKETAARRRWRLKKITKMHLNSVRKNDALVVKVPPVQPISILRNGNQDKKCKIHSDQKIVKRVSILHDGKIEIPSDWDYSDPPNANRISTRHNGNKVKRSVNYWEKSELREASMTFEGFFEDEEQQDKPPGFFEQLDFSDDDSVEYKSAASIAKDHSAGVSPELEHSFFEDEEQQDKPPGLSEQLDLSDNDSVGYKSAESIAKDVSAGVSPVLKPEYGEQQDKPSGLFEQLDFSDDDSAVYKSAASIAKDIFAGVSPYLKLSEAPGYDESDCDSTCSIIDGGSSDGSFDSAKSFIDEAKEDLNGLFMQIGGFLNKDRTKDASADFFQQFDFTDDDEAQDSFSTASSMADDPSLTMFHVDKLPWTPKHESNTKRPSTPATVATSVTSDDELKVHADSSHKTTAISFSSEESCKNDEEIGVEHTLDDLHSTLVKMKEMEALNRIEEAIRRQMMAELKQKLHERKCLQDLKEFERKKAEFEEFERKKAEIELQEEFDNWSFLQSIDDDEQTMVGSVDLSCDKEMEENTFDNETAFEKEASLRCIESLENCDQSSSLEGGTLECSLDYHSMGNKLIEKDEVEVAVPSEPVLSQMYGALEKIVLSLSSDGGKVTSKRVRFADEGKDMSKGELCVQDNDPFNERELEYYDDNDDGGDDDDHDDDDGVDSDNSDDGDDDDDDNDEDDDDDDESGDEESGDEDDSQYISLQSIHSHMTMDDTEEQEVDGGSPYKKSGNVRDKVYSSIYYSSETKRVVFNDIQPEGNKQRSLFQSRDESPLNNVHWEIDPMEAQYFTKENLRVSMGSGSSQSTLYVKPVVEELAEQYFGVTESTIVLSDSWQCQSTKNAEMRKDRSSATFGTEKMARGAIECQQRTADKMEHERASIDKVDKPHRSSRICGESNIGSGESEMFATTASSECQLNATLEWEKFSSPLFRTSFPFDEIQSVPSDEV